VKQSHTEETVRHTDDQSRATNQQVEKCHQIFLPEAVGQVTHQHASAETRGQQSGGEARSCGRRITLIFEKQNKMLDDRANGPDDQRCADQNEPEIGGSNCGGTRRFCGGVPSTPCSMPLILASTELAAWRSTPLYFGQLSAKSDARDHSP